MNTSELDEDPARRQSETVSIEVSDIDDLRALLEAVYVAKAFGSKWRPELLGSLPLARISNALVDALNELARLTNKEEHYALSDDRRSLDTKDKFWGVAEIWDVAVEKLRSKPDAWAAWRRSEKADYVKLIFSPMIISPEMIGAFIREVDGGVSDGARGA